MKNLTQKQISKLSTQELEELKRQLYIETPQRSDESKLQSTLREEIAVGNTAYVINRIESNPKPWGKIVKYDGYKAHLDSGQVIEYFHLILNKEKFQKLLEKRIKGYDTWIQRTSDALDRIKQSLSENKEHLKSYEQYVSENM